MREQNAWYLDGFTGIGGIAMLLIAGVLLGANGNRTA